MLQVGATGKRDRERDCLLPRRLIIRVEDYPELCLENLLVCLISKYELLFEMEQV
jgi:hypothetical protein